MCTRERRDRYFDHANGELLVRVSTGHVLFSRSVVRFSRLLDFIELKFDFRLRSASSRHVLSDFLYEELCTFRIRSARSSQVSKFVLVLSLLLSQSFV